MVDLSIFESIVEIIPYKPAFPPQFMEEFENFTMNLKDPRYDFVSSVLYKLPEVFDINENDTFSISVKNAKYITVEEVDSKYYLSFNIDQMKDLPPGSYIKEISLKDEGGSQSKYEFNF